MCFCYVIRVRGGGKRLFWTADVLLFKFEVHENRNWVYFGTQTMETIWRNQWEFYETKRTFLRKFGYVLCNLYLFLAYMFCLFSFNYCINQRYVSTIMILFSNVPSRQLNYLIRIVYVGFQRVIKSNQVKPKSDGLCQSPWFSKIKSEGLYKVKKSPMVWNAKFWWFWFL